MQLISTGKAGYRTEKLYTVDYGDLEKELSTFPLKIQKRALKSAALKAGRVVRKDARKAVTVQTGLLKKSLSIKTITYISGIINAIIGPLYWFGDTVEGFYGRGKKLRYVSKHYRRPTRYAHLVELGTKHSSPKPFLLPSLMANYNSIVSMFANDCRQFLNNYRAKQGV